MTGTAGADTLTGNSGYNALVGAGGNDVLDGAGGSDSCDAGTGQDTLANCETVTAVTDAAGSIDTATFTRTSGSTFFLDNLDADSATTRALSWSLTGPAGSVFSDYSVGSRDRGPYTAASGSYSLRLTGTASATHHFRIVSPTTQTYAYTLGDTVTADSPSAGEGHIEGPQDHDVYTFSGTASQQVYFETLADTTNGAAVMTLTGPTGTVVLQRYLTGDRGPFTLPGTGSYSLSIGAGTDDGTTGTYSFAVLPVPSAQSFNYTIGHTISNGVPGSGAGDLESIGSKDVYSFTATAGQSVYFDALSDGTGGFATATLTAPDGSVVLQRSITSSGTPVTLTKAGTYKLNIAAAANTRAKGTYSLRLRTATTTAQSFSYSLGSTISDGVPGSGAGNLEGVGAEDDYNFTGSSGQQLVFDSISDSTLSYGHITLFAPDGSTAWSSYLGSDRGPITLTKAGTYTAKVETSDSTHFGKYSFRFVVVPAAQTFAITVNQQVSNGVPDAGAGNLEPIGSVDHYTFTGTAGKTLTFDSTSDSTSGYAEAIVTDSKGNTVLDIFSGSDSSVNRPGMSGDSEPWKGWSHVEEHEVSGRAA